MNSFEGLRGLSAVELLARAKAEAMGRVKAGLPAQVSPATTVNKTKDETTVFVFDVIGGWWGIDPKEWVPAFTAIKAKVIHLRINSPGGGVLDAETMRVAIAQHPSKVICHIDGLCASAAIGLALACSEIEMSAGAMFMVHNSWGCCVGGEQQMLDYAALLRKTTANIVATYQRRTGKTEAQVRAWMTAESWFSATEALAHGFVDRIYVPDSGQDKNARDKRARALALAEASISKY